MRPNRDGGLGIYKGSVYSAKVGDVVLPYSKDVASTPVIGTGSLVYDTTSQQPWYSNGSTWNPLAGSTVTWTGGGVSLLAAPVGNTQPIKGLEAGSGITLVSTPTTVVISAGASPGIVGSATTVGHTTATLLTYSPAVDTVSALNLSLSALNTTNNNSNVFQLSSSAKNISGTVSLYSGFDKVAFNQDADTDVSFSVSGSSVDVIVTGSASGTVEWKGMLTIWTAP